MQLTAGELIKQLEKVDPNSVVRFQWIEDKYITGRNEHSVFCGEVIENPMHEYIANGWKTYDMPCDRGCCEYDTYKNIAMNPDNAKKYCSSCYYRNRYIDASRCFIKDNQLFIDGHY